MTDTDFLINVPTNSIYVYGAADMRVEITVNDPVVMMRAYDNDNHLVFTVYRNGRAEVEDKTKLDEVSRMFWDTFASYYRSQFFSSTQTLNCPAKKTSVKKKEEGK